MINKEERKYIRESLRLVELTKQDKNFTSGRFDAIIELLKLADNVVKKLTIPVVVSERKLLVCKCDKPDPYTMMPTKCFRCKGKIQF